MPPSQLPAPTCGTTCRYMSHLHSHSRSSDSVSRLSSSLVSTRTSWYDWLTYYCLLLSLFFFFRAFPVDLVITVIRVKHVDDDDEQTDWICWAAEYFTFLPHDAMHKHTAYAICPPPPAGWLSTTFMYCIEHHSSFSTRTWQYSNGTL